MNGQELARLLNSYRLNAADETVLQRTIEAILQRENVEYNRELRLSEEDRIDFLVSNGIGVEVKISSSPAQVLRQLFRYSEHSSINELLLVTTRSKHQNMPQMINGKPLWVLYLINSFL